MIFIQQGDKPLTDHQIQKRTQKHIDNIYPQWQRERAIRKQEATFADFMVEWEADADTNRDNNLFNQQLVDYKAAVERLSQYVLADGREEIIESQPTGEQIFDEATGEIVDVMADVVVQTAIEPLPATVEVTTYDDEGVATTETVPNPEIVQDLSERSSAEAIVDATPQAVVEAANA